jgi:hypothetical protein
MTDLNDHTPADIPTEVFLAIHEHTRGDVETVGVSVTPEGAMNLADEHSTKHRTNGPTWRTITEPGPDGDEVTWWEGSYGRSVWERYRIEKHALR